MDYGISGKTALVTGAKRGIGYAAAVMFARAGILDIAFNNAVIQTHQKPMHELTTEEYLNTLNVDLSGIWHFMHYEIEQMLKQGGGAIINTSSQGGVTGFPGQAAYIACKHAVIGLTRTAAIDYAKKKYKN